jgi:type IV pilus assembly protein PilV
MARAHSIAATFHPSCRPSLVRLRGPQVGLTLLEALIALLVMSVGLLGVAAMQVVGTQENSSALHHSQATWFAYDIADRMRANRTGVEAGAYAGLNTAATPREGEGAPVACGVAENCTPAQMAAADAVQWGAALGGLPGGAGMVDDLGNGRFRIRVLWDDDVPDPDNLHPERVTTGCPSDSTVPKTCVEITVQP